MRHIPSLLVLAPVLLAGCDLLFGLDRIEPVEPGIDNDNGYTCTCACTFPDDSTSSLRLDVCVPPTLNPNLPGSHVPTSTELADDCNDRVEVQIEEMGQECYDGQEPDCDCTVDGPPAVFFDKACDNGCASVPVGDMCGNWDPVNGVGLATCAEEDDCQDPGPVCLRPVTAQPGPTPLSARLMGQTTTCAVTDGELTVSVDDDTESAPLQGEVYFTPAGGCGAGETCLTMDYHFRTTATIAFEGIPILNIGATDIEGVVSTGGTEPFALGVSDTSFLPPDAVSVSGRAFENGDRRAAAGSNAEPLVVMFDGETCSVQGDLAGSAGDPDGDSSDATLHVFASGQVTNTPPVAAVAAPPTLECTSPGGAEVTLDATPSTDREGDIASYGWYLGSRVGPSLGLGPVLVTQQATGSQTYVLKIIDSGLQSDELTVTVSVQDTTGPALDCGAPPTITPPGTPYAFQATAADACDDALGPVEILGFDCFAINGAGQRVERSCRVEVAGDTLTVRTSGGVGNHIQWEIRATDASGNQTTRTCETVVVNPAGR